MNSLETDQAYFWEIFRELAGIQEFVADFPPKQGRRRVFKSGPAEEAIECQRHEKGIILALVRGVGGLPQNKIFEF